MARTAKASTPKRTVAASFSAEERAAAQERVKELRASAQRGPGADGEADVLAKIAEMPAADRVKAERLHKLVKTVAPQLAAKTWYGMPAYTKDGTIICHFQAAAKFKTRYATLGFSDKANFDDGEIWPVAYAVGELGPAAEKTIAALIRQAIR